MSVNAIQFLGRLKHPCHVAFCQAANVELFVS